MQQKIKNKKRISLTLENSRELKKKKERKGKQRKPCRGDKWWEFFLLLQFLMFLCETSLKHIHFLISCLVLMLVLVY